MGTEKLVSVLHNGKFQLQVYKYGACHVDRCGTQVRETGHCVEFAAAGSGSYVFVVPSELSVLNCRESGQKLGFYYPECKYGGEEFVAPAVWDKAV
jgi:hypothetical protein